MYALGHELAQIPAHKFDLTHMRVLLSALGNPEAGFPSVLIAGTNGKGSTSATLASILEASGYKTGLYTSPHLVRINERIRLDGVAISDDDFALLHDVVGRTAERLVTEADLPWHPSFFEMLTAMAFEYFARSRPDIVILEVGMGGRLDATNVVDPLVSVISDISLDHQKYLGETIPEIAREKAGIVRPGKPVVVLPQLPAANDTIGHAITDAGARAVSAVPFVPPVSPASPEYSVPNQRMSFDQDRRQYYPLEVLGETITVDSPLVGRHQLRNIALAIAAAIELRDQRFSEVTPATIERGIRETYWPGRFQVVSEALSSNANRQREARSESPTRVFVLDVAHNSAGAWALRSTISLAYPNLDPGHIIMVFGVMRDKAVQEMTEILFPVAGRIILTHASNPRSASPGEIRNAAARISADLQIEDAADVASALSRARHLTSPEDLIVVTGSIYVVGEAMRILNLSI
jgi:dihydrofolate synthase / folylpolyglutamate synthase